MKSKVLVTAFIGVIVFSCGIHAHAQQKPTESAILQDLSQFNLRVERIEFVDKIQALTGYDLEPEKGFKIAVVHLVGQTKMPVKAMIGTCDFVAVYEKRPEKEGDLEFTTTTSAAITLPNSGAWFVLKDACLTLAPEFSGTFEVEVAFVVPESISRIRVRCPVILPGEVNIPAQQ